MIKENTQAGCFQSEHSFPSFKVIEEASPFIRIFLLERDKDLTLFEKAIQIEDFSTLKLIGLGAKGSGASYGFYFLSDLGRLIEEAAESKRIGNLKNLYQLYFHYLNFIKSKLP